MILYSAIIDKANDRFNGFVIVGCFQNTGGQKESLNFIHIDGRNKFRLKPELNCYKINTIDGKNKITVICMQSGCQKEAVYQESIALMSIASRQAVQK